MLKELFKRAIYYISVPKCIQCGEILDYGESCFCPKCREVYEKWKARRCSHCHKLLQECSCPSLLLLRHRVRKVFKVYRYRVTDDPTPNHRAIFALKESKRRDVFDFLADELAASIRNCLGDKTEGIIVTNVPRRVRAILEFGYDHAAELAKRVASRLGLEYYPILVSRSKRAQKKLSTTDRRKNAKFDIRKGKIPDLSGKTVLVIDDIITSGFSISEAAVKLRGLGARKIFAGAIGIAYKDIYLGMSQRINHKRKA